MTTYRAIVSTETDPQAPGTSALFKALDANPTAITEGASGAPRIYGNAMHGPAAGTVIQRNCLNFGSETVSSNSATLITKEIYQSAFTALVACTVRVRCTFTLTGGATAGSFVILKNGVASTTFTTAQTNADTDVVLAQGDYLGCEITATGTGGGTTGTTTLTKLEYRFDARSSIMT